MQVIWGVAAPAAAMAGAAPARALAVRTKAPGTPMPRALTVCWGIMPPAAFGVSGGGGTCNCRGVCSGSVHTSGECPCTWSPARGYWAGRACDGCAAGGRAACPAGGWAACHDHSTCDGRRAAPDGAVLLLCGGGLRQRVVLVPKQRRFGGVCGCLQFQRSSNARENKVT